MYGMHIYKHNISVIWQQHVYYSGALNAFLFVFLSSSFLPSILLSKISYCDSISVTFVTQLIILLWTITVVFLQISLTHWCFIIALDFI